MNAHERDVQAAQVVRDPRWAALVNRTGDAPAFYYSVSTTGIYCRSSCKARRPRPENVKFYATREEAEKAGFRPCKRCRPDLEPLHQHIAQVTAVCRRLETAEDTPTLPQLAQEVGLSSYHLHRIFKQATGLTPRQYALAKRHERLREQLAQQASVTEAVFSAGYNTSSRFYEHANEVLGMKPADYRAGGRGNRIRFAVGECSLGSLLVGESNRGICHIALGDDPDELIANFQRRFPLADLVGGDPAFEQLMATVVGFVETPAVGLELPLDIRGTAFQQRVWQALQEIPCGKTVTYADIAERIGAPAAVRAVAGACAANSLAVAIPCHRVVRKDGSLSGYRWGVERKRVLLARECSDAD